MQQPPHILIVDDEPPVLLTYELILRQQGYEVTAAASRQEALEQLGKASFELLICDLALDGERGGIDVIDRAREISAGVPAILLTGYASEEAIAEAAQKRIAILYKPIDIQELLATMRTLFTRSDRRPA